MFLKQLFDRTVALLGLLILWPILLMIWILIHICMPDGPAFFIQKRVGKDGKLFDIYKFRTMVMAHSGDPVTVAGETRITPLGHILRRWKLDALPELWNVLIGDMSIVGPRPDVPGYADQLQGEDRIILKMRPGITGPASLKYRDEENLLAHMENPQKANDTIIYPDKVRINRYYCEHYCFLIDIQIILCTIFYWKMNYNGERI